MERRCRFHFVGVIQAIPKAEFQVDARGLGLRGRGDAVIVLTQMPIFVVDIHLHVERVPDLAALAKTPGVKDDLSVRVLRDRYVSDSIRVGGDLIRRRMIGEPSAYQRLHGIG